MLQMLTVLPAEAIDDRYAANAPSSELHERMAQTRERVSDLTAGTSTIKTDSPPKWELRSLPLLFGRPSLSSYTKGRQLCRCCSGARMS